MKLLISIITLLLLTNTVIAQQPDKRDFAVQKNHSMFNKEWVGPGGEYMRIVNDSAFFPSPFGNSYKVRYGNKKLTLISAPYAAQDEALFTVVHISEDTLIVDAVNDNAFRLVKRWSHVVFVSLHHLDGITFPFQAIFFERSGGGMIRVDYSNVQFKIDSSGAMLFSCMPERGNLNGTYKGQLSPEQLAQLNALINRSQPERLALASEMLQDEQGYSQKIEDAQGYAFRFYYKKKMTEANMQWLPYLSRGLVDFLESLPATVPLEKVSGNYGIRK